jgi:hypothetical protein
MAYIGQGIKGGTFSVLDTSGNTYNGSNVTFNLGTQVGSPAQLLVSHDGVIQKPVTDYTIATGGTQITFTTAPASGASIFITEISGAVGAPMNRDINGDELILDADADTSITADTDDQIDIKVAGTDQITIKDGAVSPVTDNDVDLGTTSLEFKDGYFDGTLHCDVLDLAGTEYTSIPNLDGSITINDSGAAADFRVETDGQTHALYTDGGNNRLHMFNSSTNLVSNSSNVYGVELVSGGSFTVSANGSAPLDINRQNSDGTLVNLHQEGNGEGTIAVSGSTVAYNTFCGTHWSRLADNSKPTILRGTIIESIATMMDWYQLEYQKEDGHTFKESIALPNGKSTGDNHTMTIDGISRTGKILKEDNEQLPMCKISDTADSKAVYGVFMDWDDNDDGSDGDVNDMHVASLGAFVVRIHKDETVAIGNWLVSNGDGTAKVLAGNTTITADVQSSLIGKVTSTTKTHTHADDSYCVPCTLHCG